MTLKDISEGIQSGLTKETREPILLGEKSVDFLYKYYENDYEQVVFRAINVLIESAKDFINKNDYIFTDCKTSCYHDIDKGRIYLKATLYGYES